MQHTFDTETQQHKLVLEGAELSLLLDALDALSTANGYNPSKSISGLGKALAIATFHSNLKQVTNA